MKNTPYVYSPFGLGHRSCIGKRFAMIEAVVFTTMILQKYTVSLADPNYKLQQKLTITSRISNELNIKFTRRN